MAPTRKTETKNNKVDVAVIGAGLTGLTAAFYLVKAGLSVAVIEKQERIGGVIRTIHKDGFIIEAGPNTGVFSTPELVRLFDDLGDRCKPEFANSKGKQRWIWKGGRWHPLPSGLRSAIATPLFSWYDKFRILAEPFRKRGTDPYETVAQLVRRRMGKSYLDYAVDPFISGIYAGDPGRLVTQFALPKLHRLEQEYGSFIRGAAKKRKEPKDELTKRATREVFSVKGGLQELTDALGEAVGREHFRLGAGGLKVGRAGEKYIATFTQNGEMESIEADRVVSTTGGYALRDIFGSTQAGGEESGSDGDSGLKAGSQEDGSHMAGRQNIRASRPGGLVTGSSSANSPMNGNQKTGSHGASGQDTGLLNTKELEPFDKLQYARVVEVVAAYRQWPGIPLNAFGGLIPSKERRDALGILFTSSIFEGRAPEGGAILSVFMGGMRRPEIYDKTDEEIGALAMKEIGKTLQTGGAQPAHLEIFRYRYAIPQYEKSTGERLAAVRSIEERYPGLLLAGNIRDGIGMADRVKQGVEIAQRIIGENRS
jgi:protoporphyrinogen/coproporphyrinogen III oxidase